MGIERKKEYNMETVILEILMVILFLSGGLIMFSLYLRKTFREQDEAEENAKECGLKEFSKNVALADLHRRCSSRRTTLMKLKADAREILSESTPEREAYIKYIDAELEALDAWEKEKCNYIKNLYKGK